MLHRNPNLEEQKHKTHLCHGLSHCQTLFLADLRKLIRLIEKEGRFGLFDLGRHTSIVFGKVSSDELCQVVAVGVIAPFFGRYEGCVVLLVVNNSTIVGVWSGCRCSMFLLPASISSELAGTGGRDVRTQC